MFGKAWGLLFLLCGGIPRAICGWGGYRIVYHNFSLSQLKNMEPVGVLTQLLNIIVQSSLRQETIHGKLKIPLYFRNNVSLNKYLS
jgi:hypothetical protein